MERTAEAHTGARAMQEIFERIAAADTIIITRHSRPDGDAVGSTLGLSAILRASFPAKRVFLDNDDRAEYLAFLGDEGPRPAPEDYAAATLIVLDTGTPDRIANARVFDAKCVIKIDHHICREHYGDLAWVEEERSSVCEMIAEFYRAFADRLTLTKYAAECLYTGMVTDSGRFRFRGTTGDTMRLAAMLLDAGVDFERLFSQLGGEDLETVRFEGYLASKIRTTESGAAYLRISKRLRLKHGISLEDACNTVSLMEHIKGSLIWIAFIENDDGSVRVRLRSRFVEVQQLAARFGGGGHACASGATVNSRAEEAQLLAEADKLLMDYKEKAFAKSGFCPE